MPRKAKATTEPADTSPEAPALVRMVASASGFKCADHEGEVKPHAPFSTTEDRAVHLESQNLAAREG